MITTRFKFSLSLVAVLILIGCGQQSAQELSGEVNSQQAIPKVVDFNFHVKPILSDRCFKCHGPDANKREGDLAFHDKDLAFAALGNDKDRHAIVPGDTALSTLIKRINTNDPDDIMPPPESNLTLSEWEKQVLTKWIEQGAEWKEHWALISPENPQLPEVDQEKFLVANEIDLFVADKQKNQNLTPVGRAPKEKLLRRLAFDLTGLPPTVEELDEFLSDNSADAFEKMIDHYLGSIHYAERMTLEWMDIARYADTHGYQDDFERVMWPWRDWVIHSYQKNMPYDEFVTWQLAGDLMPDPSIEQVIATGFNRNHKITAEGGVIPEEYRVEYVADRTETFSKAFLGLTMECSRCHDHKYDPLSQKDYFSLYSFFNNIPENGYEPINQNNKLVPIPMVEITKEQMESTLAFINNREELDTIGLMVMEESKPRETFILDRGRYDSPSIKVSSETPGKILPVGKVNGNRLDLAEWLFSPENPLTARVAVNRLWQQMFGRGIVATAADFGNQGSLPTHPELLDFLALKYQNEGWDTKAMLKYMAMSEAYQRSVVSPEGIEEIDPENMWLTHAPRLRLNGEQIRDQALAISGLLNDEVGGPSVKPYQPEGIWAETTGGGGGSTSRYVQSSGDQLYRKSLYTFWKRTVPPPSMMTFDAPSRDLCSVQRSVTNTPLQALILLNDPQIIEASRVLAQKAMSGESPEERIDLIFRLATSRIPKEEEREVLLSYLEEELAKFQSEPEKAEAFLSIGEYEQSTESDTVTLAAYAVVANAILNLDESISRG